MAQLKRYNGTSWENVGGSVAPKTSQTTSDTDTYSCNYVNNNLTNIKSAIDYKSPDYMGDVVVESIRSKNIFVGIIEQGSFLPSTGEPVSGTTRVRSASFTNVKAGNYTISLYNNNNFDVVVYVYDIDGTWKSSESITDWQSLPYTINIQGERKIKIAIRNKNNSTIVPSDVQNVQIEEGNTATTYSPYQNLDGYDNYSIGEQVIGTWIDGKPIYRTVIKYTLTIDNNNYGTYIGASSLITKIDNLVDFKFYVYNGTLIEIVPNCPNSGDDRTASTYIQRSYGGIGFMTNSTSKAKYNGNTAQVILEYTKTTD